MDFLNKVANQAAQAAAGSQQGHHQQQQQHHSSAGAGDMLGKLGGLVSGNNNHGQQQQQQSSSGAGALLDKLHGLAGGGPESEKKEDALDKGIDWVQEKVLKQGSQDNEGAAEQAKDKLIADTIRSQYKKATGKDFPIAEKKEEKKSGFASAFGL